MKYEETTLEPSVAQALLDSQPHNRSISRPLINKMKADIAAGRYLLNPNPISITSDGRMIDGQHRCTACVETGTPIPVVIAWDVDSAVRTVLDSGRPRSIYDVLLIDHPTITGATNKAAAASMILRYERYPERIWSANLTPTRMELETELVEFQDDYQVGISYAQSITTAVGRGGMLATRSALTALYLLVDRHSPSSDRFDAFAAGMKDPVAECEGNKHDPRYIYREQTKGVLWGSGQSTLLAGLVAWNAYVDGRDIKVIIPRRNMLPMPKVR